MLTEKIALVTGASRGIGKAIAQALGAEKATVIGTATSQSGADAISATFAENNIKGTGMVLDVADPDERALEERHYRREHLVAWQPPQRHMGLDLLARAR